MLKVTNRNDRNSAKYVQVNNKDTRMTSLTLLALVFFDTTFTPFFSVSTVGFQ